MKIKLSDIIPSPRPVRTTWDEDKMDELVQSIKEQGVIVPIKVRPKGDSMRSYMGTDVWRLRGEPGCQRLRQSLRAWMIPRRCCRRS